MNVSDSELVMKILEDNGFKIVDHIDRADVIIFNTCTVRQHAEDRALGRITNEMSRKKDNKDLKIGIIGCVAQRLGKNLLQNKGIDFIVGTDQYLNLPEIITGVIENSRSLCNTRINNNEIYAGLYPAHQGEFSAYVTIMRGCNNFCSYCIVPYTRGSERSRRAEDIFRELRRAGERGFKDITLLGQNVNSYNYKKLDFPLLLKETNKIDSINRIRFVTSHPKDLSDRLIDIMAKSEKVCEHIHLPMQSGDNEILRVMNRGYTAEHYLGLVKKLRKAMPEIAITTDIIAGFPGETEQQFLNTYKMMKEIEFDYAFTFKFSPRNGTKASEFDNQVPEILRLDRLQKLIKLQQQITHKKYQQQIGKIKEIYVEKVSKKNIHEISGKSRDFKITVFPGSEDLIGKFVRVKITDAVGWTLKGKLLDHYPG